MKKIYTILIFFIYFIVTSFIPINFNKQNVYEITKELSSEKYRGRLAGDKGNILAEEYITTYFKKLGLKPLYENYRQSFSVFVPLLEGECSLKVFNQDKKLVKEYKYAQDFKEIISGKSQGGKIFTKLNSKTVKFEEGFSSEGNSTYTYDQNLLDSGVKAVIYSFDRMMRFRSPYKEQIDYKDGLIKISVEENTLKELKEYKNKGYYVEIKSPVNYKKVTVNNIVAIKEGKNKSLPPIIFSAHFDHVGFDADGVIYNGSLDNASGTAMLLEIARAIKDTDIERSVIFAAFNAEEEGLIGSKYFVENSKINLQNAEVINFDMVGSKENVDLSILTSSNRSSFSKEISRFLTDKIRIKYLYEDNSDHASFCTNNIDAVTFIHDDTSKIHTPMDTIENIDIDRFEVIFNAVNLFLSQKATEVYSSKVETTYININQLLAYYFAVLLILVSTLKLYMVWVQFNR